MNEAPIYCAFTGRLGNNLYSLLNAYIVATKLNRPLKFYNAPDRFDELSRTVFRNYADVEILHKDLLLRDGSCGKLLAENSNIIGFQSDVKVHMRDVQVFAPTISCPDEVKEEIVSKYPELKDCVSIHVRRGDYLKNENVAVRFAVLGSEYYNAAVAALEKYTKAEQKYVVFSDDIDWCKEHLDIRNMVFFDSSKFPPSSIYDFYAMSLCKANIIGNSTFSQWASILNETRLVVFPSSFRKEDEGRIRPLIRKIFWKIIP